MSLLKPVKRNFPEGRVKGCQREYTYQELEFELCQLYITFGDPVNESPENFARIVHIKDGIKMLADASDVQRPYAIMNTPSRYNGDIPEKYPTYRDALPALDRLNEKFGLKDHPATAERVTIIRRLINQLIGIPDPSCN